MSVNNREVLIEAIVAKLLREVGIDAGVEPEVAAELRALAAAAAEAAADDPDAAAARAQAAWEARREEAQQAYQRRRTQLIGEAVNRLAAMGVPRSPEFDPPTERDEPGTLLPQA